MMFSGGSNDTLFYDEALRREKERLEGLSTEDWQKELKARQIPSWGVALILLAYSVVGTIIWQVVF